MPIKMNCPSCGKTLAAPDSSFGKKVKCPACGQIMTVPEVAQAAEPVGAGAAGPAGAVGQTSAPPSPAADGETRWPCPECGEMIVAGAAKCRFCNAIFDPKLKLLKTSGPGSGNEELRQIASFQRGVIFSILIQILANVVYYSTAKAIPILALVSGLVALVGLIAGVVFAILVATRVYSKGMGIFLGLLTIIPCLNLVILLIINQAATKRLTENGIKVGFFGASMSQF